MRSRVKNIAPANANVPRYLLTCEFYQVLWLSVGVIAAPHRLGLALVDMLTLPLSWGLGLIRDHMYCIALRALQYVPPPRRSAWVGPPYAVGNKTAAG